MHLAYIIPQYSSLCASDKSCFKEYIRAVDNYNYYLSKDFMRGHVAIPSKRTWGDKAVCGSGTLAVSDSVDNSEHDSFRDRRNTNSDVLQGEEYLSTGGSSLGSSSVVDLPVRGKNWEKNKMKRDRMKRLRLKADQDVEASRIRTERERLRLDRERSLAEADKVFLASRDSREEKRMIALNQDLERARVQNEIAKAFQAARADELKPERVAAASEAKYHRDRVSVMRDRQTMRLWDDSVDGDYARKRILTMQMEYKESSLANKMKSLKKREEREKAAERDAAERVFPALTDVNHPDAERLEEERRRLNLDVLSKKYGLNKNVINKKIAAERPEKTSWYPGLFT